MSSAESPQVSSALVDVIFLVYEVKISRKIPMHHIPSVGDDVYIGLQRSVVRRRWWNLEHDGPSIMADLTEFNGESWKGTTENWVVLLRTLDKNQWHWSGNFTQELTKAWAYVQTLESMQKETKEVAE